jgi:hypothetical protein
VQQHAAIAPLSTEETPPFGFHRGTQPPESKARELRGVRRAAYGRSVFPLLYRRAAVLGSFGSRAWRGRPGGVRPSMGDPRPERNEKQSFQRGNSFGYLRFSLRPKSISGVCWRWQPFS